MCVCTTTVNMYQCEGMHTALHRIQSHSFFQMKSLAEGTIMEAVGTHTQGLPSFLTAENNQVPVSPVSSVLLSSVRLGCVPCVGNSSVSSSSHMDAGQPLHFPHVSPSLFFSP